MSANQRTPGMFQGVMLLLPITMSVMGISVLTPVVPLMLDQFSGIPNHEYLVIGGVLTMPAIWILLFSPVAGWLADHYGRRRILLTSMVVYAAVGVAPVFLNNLYAIIATRAGVGICEAVVLTASTTMIGDYFKGRARERWMASQTAVASLSAVGIVYVGGEFGDVFGWRGPFVLYLYSLPLALIAYFALWEAPAELSRPPEPNTNTVSDPSFPWVRILGICALTLLASISFYSVITKNAQALVSLGIHNPALIGKFTMLASIGVPVGTFIYWRVARLPINWLLCLDFLAIGIGFTWMAVAKSPQVYAGGSFICQIGCGMVLPTMLVWVTRDLSYAVRGRGIGMWQATFAIGQFVSGMVVTLLSKHLGGLLSTFGLMGRAMVILAILSGIIGSGRLLNKPALA